VRLVAIGLVAGFFSALFGVGGGIVVVPALVLFERYGPHRAAATSLGAIGIIALVGTVTYAVHGDIKPGAAALVGLPGAVGAFAGAALQQRISARPLALAFAALLVALGIELIVS
jgi:uncharacterized membrane protein YfcA